jgi:acetyl-CoA synthetase
MAQKNIKSVLHEQRVFAPPAKFAKRATLRHAALEAMYAKAAEDYVGFWADLAVAEIDWHKPFTVPLDDADAPNYRWFSDGQLNVSLQLHRQEPRRACGQDRRSSSRASRVMCAR